MTQDKPEIKGSAVNDNRRVIAVDAMGGDIGPAAMVPGVVEALRRSPDIHVSLYGDPDLINAELAKLDAGDLPLQIVTCTQDIEMGESPASAIRSKTDSPIVRAMYDNKSGDVSAVVSAGSTGAMTAGSLMILGRLPAVDRPAIATVIPTLESRFVLLDAGANVQNTPGHLHSFAVMGSLYSRAILEVASPRVGLLNIGGEASKGTELLVEAHKLLTDSDLNFAGNVESKAIMFDAADVVVTDGFTGNIVLKLIEGFGVLLKEIAGTIMKGVASDGSGVKSGLGELLGRMDYAAYGGALLLGVNGTPIICHGASSPRAITNAVLTAQRLIEFDMPTKLQQEIAGNDE
jgi:phosphate acyltransferase